MITVVTPDQLRHAADDLLRASRATRYIDGVRAVRDAIQHVHAGVDWLHPLDCTGLWREFPAAMAGLSQAAQLRLLVEATRAEQDARQEVVGSGYRDCLRPDGSCAGCGAASGTVHIGMCDWERCGKCHHQRMCCGCDQEEVVDTIDKWLEEVRP